MQNENFKMVAGLIFFTMTLMVQIFDGKPHQLGIIGNIILLAFFAYKTYQKLK